MDQVTQQNAAIVEEANAASSMLATEAERLCYLITRFQLGDARTVIATATRPAVASRAATPAPSPTRRMVNKLVAGGGAAAVKQDDRQEF